MITFGRVARRDLGLLVVGRVVVRRAGGELGRAGVDGLVDRPDAERVAQRRGPRPRRPARPQRGDLPVGEAVPLGPAQQLAASSAGALDDLRAAPRSSRRSGRGTTGRCRWPRAPPRRWRRAAAPAPPCRAGRRAASAAASSSGLSGGALRVAPVQKPAALRLQRAQRLLQRLGEVAADRHRLADGLHRRGQRRVGAGELLEREPRHLHHDVVERRLEADAGVSRVMSLGISSRV